MEGTRKAWLPDGTLVVAKACDCPWPGDKLPTTASCAVVYQTGAPQRPLEEELGAQAPQWCPAAPSRML